MNPTLESLPGMFELDPRLRADTLLVGKTDLCSLLLMNDSRYPWLILVPELLGVTEPFDLTKVDQTTLWEESMVLAAFMKRHFSADKLNVAALGNQVARFHHDEAWPGPVWGVGAAVPYGETAAQEQVLELREGLVQALSLTVPQDR
jgi:diadenosine tetraphosphate (Ap4A) HIT family hydrolase